MREITQTGREFYFSIANDFDSTPAENWNAQQVAASLIVHHARTYKRIQEAWCSIEMDEAQTKAMERREMLLEKRIAELVAALPTVQGQPITVKFGGDPRGYTVKLIMASGKSNTWGGAEDGYGVPNS